MKPITTLFMLMSVDGKISTGNSDELDMDKDLPNINGVKNGLYQYYEIEACSDLWSLNTGRVMEKMGMNERQDMPKKSPVSFVIIDHSLHLQPSGILYLCNWLKQLIIVTNNKKHPAFGMQLDNLNIIYQAEFNPSTMLQTLCETYQIERLTIQSGGTMNGLFLREHLFDYIDIVVAPLLIGGKDTASLIDGTSLISTSQLGCLDALKLISCEVLEDSYLRLRYECIHA